MMKSLLLSAPILVALSSSAFADDVSIKQQPAPEKVDSLNLSPLGLLWADLYMNYEHMFPGGNGLVIDAGGGLSSNASSEEGHGTLGVGYRWHWRHRENSGFLGVMVHQSIGSGYVEESDGTTMSHYDMAIRETQVTANIGKRWMLGSQNRWNITLRFGLGVAKRTATAKDDSPDAKMAEDQMNKLLSIIPIGVDGELSVGYNF
jgi:opacity protein-like surface antigen